MSIDLNVIFTEKGRKSEKNIDRKINFMSTSLDSKRYCCCSWLFQIEYAIWLDKFPVESNLQPTAVKPFFLRQINFQLNQSDRESKKNPSPFVINSNFPDDMISKRVGWSVYSVLWVVSRMNFLNNDTNTVIDFMFQVI